MKVKKEAWENFISIMDTESNDSNFKVDFKVITKKYGVAYIIFCKAMWEANDDVQTEEEFCKMNGNMPMGFFNNKIK
jgi:uncharacterized protein YrzB (UPF0473 family)